MAEDEPPSEPKGPPSSGQEPPSEGLSRRGLLLGGAATLGAGLLGRWAAREPEARSLLPRVAAREEALHGGDRRVALIPCRAYQAAALDEALEQGLERAPPPELQGQRVVLKPNFVEFHAGRPITTHVELLRALVRAFRARGAAEVVVAEGPGHRRDTDEVWARAGLLAAAAADGFPLVDLNIDRVRAVRFETLPGETPSQLEQVWLPATVLDADVLVSVPKLKTHHWAGCTLGMKNLFGVVPGIKYGWPKNLLHFNGIRRSIVELAANLPVAYTVIDGVEGMEGDGPIMGDPVPSGCLVMGRSRMAVDWAGARVMGLAPERLEVLQLASQAGLGPLRDPELVGESLAGLRREFRLLPEWEKLRG